MALLAKNILDQISYYLTSHIFLLIPNFKKTTNYTYTQTNSYFPDISTFFSFTKFAKLIHISNISNVSRKQNFIVKISNGTTYRDGTPRIRLWEGLTTCLLARRRLGIRQIAARLNYSRKKVTRQKLEECQSKRGSEELQTCVRICTNDILVNSIRGTRVGWLILQNRCTLLISINSLLPMTPIYRTHLLVPSYASITLCYRSIFPGRFNDYSCSIIRCKNTLKISIHDQKHSKTMGLTSGTLHPGE